MEYSRLRLYNKSALYQYGGYYKEELFENKELKKKYDSQTQDKI